MAQLHAPATLATLSLKKEAHEIILTEGESKCGKEISCPFCEVIHIYRHLQYEFNGSS
jgi:hypothetical protein